MSKPQACLAVGGSDSCGGAGIQSDLAVFARAGVKGCSAITALTAQNPDIVSRIEPSPVAQLEAEMLAIFDYYEISAVKTGMLLDAAHVQCVSRVLSERHAGKTVVIDPVILSSSGKTLLDDDGIEMICATLFPRATLITPNLPEASRLLGRPSGDPVEDASELAMRFHTSILLKGGHQEDSDRLTDVLVSTTGDVRLFSHPRQPWSRSQSHGTGCRLASGVAAELAKGHSLIRAVEQGLSYLA